MKKERCGSRRPAAAARLCFVCALCLALSGCFDVFHYITRLDNGADRHVIKMGVPRMFVEEALDSYEEEEPGESMKALEEYMKSIFLDPQIYAGYGGQVTLIDNEHEVGYRINLELQYDKKTVANIIDREPPFIPRYIPEGMIIPLKGITVDDDDDMTRALGAMGRYYLLLSKRCMASIARAAASGPRYDIPEYGFEADLELIDTGDQYLIRMPFNLLKEYRYLMLYSD